MVLTYFAEEMNERVLVDVPIENDTTVENLEQFFANLVLLTTPLNVTVEPSRATILIVDEDGKALLCVSREVAIIDFRCALLHIQMSSLGLIQTHTQLMKRLEW